MSHMSISSVSTTDNITSMLVVSCARRLRHLYHLCWCWWHSCTRHTWPACLVTINILITPSCEQNTYYYLLYVVSGVDVNILVYLHTCSTARLWATVTQWQPSPAQTLPYLGLEMMRGIFHLNFTFEILSRHCQVGGHAATPTVLLQATLQKKENH